MPLPPVLVLAGDEWDSRLIALLADEIGKDQPGQGAVLDRLVDLVVTAALRSWFSRADAGAPTWYRAALARRFSELVGEPPMSFLTGWRLALAADRLREPGTTNAAVARKVGYGSPFALSSAFKRVRGITP